MNKRRRYIAKRRRRLERLYRHFTVVECDWLAVEFLRAFSANTTIVWSPSVQRMQA